MKKSIFNFKANNAKQTSTNNICTCLKNNICTCLNICGLQNDDFVEQNSNTNKRLFFISKNKAAGQYLCLFPVPKAQLLYRKIISCFQESKLLFINNICFVYECNVTEMGNTMVHEWSSLRVR